MAMDHRNRKCALLFLLIILPASVRAERVLTWQDSVAIASQKNPDLLAADRGLESRRAGYKESFNTLFPQLDLSNSYTRTQGDSSDSNRWSGSARVSLDLFTMSGYAGISSARASFEQSAASYRLASANVLLNLRRAFADLLFAQEQVRVAQIILNIRKNNASLVSLRYDSGRESKGNKLRSQAELMDAESGANQAQRDRRAAEQEFNRQLGEETFETTIATGTLVTQTLPSDAGNPADFVENHPTVARSRAELKSADAFLSSARSVLFPSVSASYSRSVEGPDYFPDEDYGWSAGATLSLPIFGGGPTSAYYSVAAAKRAREQADENLRSTRYNVRSTLESSYAGFATSVEQVEVQRAFLNAARQRNQEADIRYSNGLMSYEDWERIVTERVNFERSVIQAQRNAVFAEADWDNARGKGLGDLQ